MSAVLAHVKHWFWLRRANKMTEAELEAFLEEMTLAELREEAQEFLRFLDSVEEKIKTVNGQPLQEWKLAFAHLLEQTEERA